MDDPGDRLLHWDLHEENVLASVVFGGWIAVQALSTSGYQGGTTVHIRKATSKRNHFHG